MHETGPHKMPRPSRALSLFDYLGIVKDSCFLKIITKAKAIDPPTNLMKLLVDGPKI